MSEYHQPTPFGLDRSGKKKVPVAELSNSCERKAASSAADGLFLTRARVCRQTRLLPWCENAPEKLPIGSPHLIASGGDKSLGNKRRVLNAPPVSLAHVPHRSHRIRLICARRPAAVQHCGVECRARSGAIFSSLRAFTLMIAICLRLYRETPPCKSECCCCWLSFYGCVS